MTTFLPAEKGMTIRQPSTANLMLDSLDRADNYPLANDFQITSNQSILNGFFTRIGTTEVVLEYDTANISAAFGNNTFTIDLSGTVAGIESNTITIPDGNYTVAALLEAMAVEITDLSGNWSAVGSGFGAWLQPAADVWAGISGPIAEALGIDITPGSLILVGPTVPPPYQQGFKIRFGVPDLRPYRYLDFVSSQLTYNQDLKDGSTRQNLNRDVLCRWYMSWDQPPPLDALGFPILMGYLPFQLRRSFSPPKQIRWDNIQPLGNLSFQVYNDAGVLAPWTVGTNWLMTLQVSEV